MHDTGDKKRPGPFELSGGALCLDFANTWGNRLDPETDRVQAYGDLLDFARQTEMLGESTVVVLSRAAAEDPDAAEAALNFAREMRETVYRIFSDMAGDRAVAAHDLETINAVLGSALSHRKLERRDGAYEWSWFGIRGNDLRALLWPVLDSVSVLLTSSEIHRVHECDAEDCNWLFIDRSRGGARRWCSMRSCGNRAKARRHYRRKQKR